MSVAKADQLKYKARRKQPLGMAQDLESLASFISEENNFNSDDRLRELLPLDFRGLDTDLDICIETARYLNAGRELTIKQEDFHSCVRSFLETGSVDSLGQVKLLVSSGDIGQLEESLELVGLDPEDTLESALTALDEQERWYSTFESTASLVGLDTEVQIADVSGIITAIEHYNQFTDGIAELSHILSILESSFADPRSDLREIQITLTFADQVQPAIFANPILLTSILFSAKIVENVQRLRTLGARAKDWQSRECTLFESISRVALPTFSNNPEENGSRSFRALKQILSKALADQSSLGSWVRLLEATNSCSKPPLKHFADLYKSNQGCSLPEVYRAVYWHSLARQALRRYPVLSRFSGESQAHARQRFRDLDQEILRLNRAKIAACLCIKTPPPGTRQGPRSTWREMALVQVLLPQTCPRVTIRDLVRRAGRSLQVLQPCFMMSPGSVAQFLKPGSVDFDLVIIDEASQMRPEEAIGSIARSQQSVVVGDPMQLPPTSFFNRFDTLDEDLEEDVDDESILDMSLGAFSPYRDLRWHYRSRHHDLIRFSNRHFYQDRLIVFPSPEDSAYADLGVRYQKVDATYLGKGGNPQEAHHVALAAIRALKEHPEWSLGIVAVNREQTDLIRLEVDQFLLRDRAARRIWDQWEGTLEPCFIKNLENVQGDERDRVIISTVYGPNADNKVLQRFGPIVNKNGHRRLNVLYTRAKRRVDVYSSMSSSDITIDERSSLGLRAFQGYLSYAATLQLDTGISSGREPDSEFEVFVADALRVAGYEVVPQVGAGGYFIDLGIRHPMFRHGFLAGIECDGATYHSSRSAKDRDSLRQAVLEDLGWTIYRVWSTDWFSDPRGETAKLISFLERLCREKADDVLPRAEISPETSAGEVFHSADLTADLSQNLIDPHPSDMTAERGQDSYEVLNPETAGELQSSSVEESAESADQAEQLSLPPAMMMPSSEEAPKTPISSQSEFPPASARVHIGGRVGNAGSYISVDQARQQLIRFRENQIQRRFRGAPREHGLLRRAMLEALLQIRPMTPEQFRENIPESLRLSTDHRQIEAYLEFILSVIRRILPA